jgi:hypothetical protein
MPLFSPFHHWESKASCLVMPLGAALHENQPALGADAIDALRLKLRRFTDRLAFTKRHSDSPLPVLAWHKENISDLSALVHAV